VISIVMNTYKKRTRSYIYRKIYKQHYGPIPKESGNDCRGLYL
jgi:hypothetical protein